MRRVRNRAVQSATWTLILASPGVALLMVIVAEMPIDLLMNLMAPALVSLTTIGALGWLALQRQAALLDGAFTFKHDRNSEEPTRVPAPPI